MTTHTARTVDPCDIRPAHEVRDAAKLSTLTASMAANGWSGRAILAYEYAGSVCALTGSHRIAAARAAELAEVPALVISDESAEVDEDECGGLTADALYNARKRSGSRDVTVGDVLREVTELCGLPSILRDLGLGTEIVDLATAEDA